MHLRQYNTKGNTIRYSSSIHHVALWKVIFMSVEAMVGKCINAFVSVCMFLMELVE